MQEEGFEPSKALSQQISHFTIEKGTYATFCFGILHLESVTFDRFATPAPYGVTYYAVVKFLSLTHHPCQNLMRSRAVCLFYNKKRIRIA